MSPAADTRAPGARSRLGSADIETTSHPALWLRTIVKRSVGSDVRVRVGRARP
jgi:hypothetical protein